MLLTHNHAGRILSAGCRRRLRPASAVGHPLPPAHSLEGRKVKSKIGLTAVWLATLVPISAATRPTAPALTLHPVVGDRFANVFSRTISITAPGLDAWVSRNSGSGVYRTVAVSGDQIRLDGQFLYDGRAISHSLSTLSDSGRTVCWDARCGPATDASGLAYNPWLWGTPPSGLHVGQSWHVQIPAPWELGPSGDQTVKVVAIDQRNGEATLERFGEAEGIFDQDPPVISMKSAGKTVSFAVTPGRARWNGWARFRRGIVLSDVLLVERPVKLKSDAGPAIDGLEREYVLLNAIDPTIVSSG